MFKKYVLMLDQLHRYIDIQTCSNANFRVIIMIIGKPRSSVPQ